MKWVFGIAVAVWVSTGTVFAGGKGEDNPYEPGRWLGYANPGSGPGYDPTLRPAIVSPYSRQAPPLYYWNHWDRYDWRQSMGKEWASGWEPQEVERQAYQDRAMKKRWKRYRND